MEVGVQQQRVGTQRVHQLLDPVDVLPGCGGVRRDHPHGVLEQRRLGVGATHMLAAGHGMASDKVRQHTVQRLEDGRFHAADVGPDAVGLGVGRDLLTQGRQHAHRSREDPSLKAADPVAELGVNHVHGPHIEGGLAAGRVRIVAVHLTDEESLSETQGDGSPDEAEAEDPDGLVE